MLTGVKYRAYPSREQQRLLAQMFGNQRFVWNWLLEIQKKCLSKGEGLLSRFDMMALIPKLIAEYPWLEESKVDVLRLAADALSRAFVRWRKGISRLPRFKKRRHDGSITTYQPNKAPPGYAAFSRSLRIPVVEYCSVDGRLKRLTISRALSGRYFAGCLRENDEILPDHLHPTGVIGVDEGLKTFVVLSTGRKIRHGKHLHHAMANLKRQDRRLSRRKRGSHRWERQRIRIAKIHERVANARSYETHLITTNLVRKAKRESQAIAYQKTDIGSMLRNHKLAMAVTDAAWGQMRKQLEYKCARAGVPLIIVDQWEPTSHPCHACGVVAQGKTLKDRVWICTGCGVRIDRDVNAARVIAKLATEILRRREAPSLDVEGGASGEGMSLHPPCEASTGEVRAKKAGVSG